MFAEATQWFGEENHFQIWKEILHRDQGIEIIAEPRLFNFIESDLFASADEWATIDPYIVGQQINRLHSQSFDYIGI